MSDNTAPSSSHRLLAVARLVWLLYVAGLLIIYLLSLPGYFERVTTGTVPTDIVFEIGAPMGNGYFTARADNAALTVRQYVIANTVASVLIITVHTAVALLIFWRLPHSGFGLLSATVIFLIGTSAAEDVLQVTGLLESTGPWLLALFQLGALVWPLFPIWVYLFPDGRAVPSWARWPIGVAMAFFAVFMFGGILESVGLLPRDIMQAIVDLNDRFNLVFVLVLPGLLLALGSQIFRYLRVSGPVERQQTKWFLFGLMLFVVLFPLADLPVFQRVNAISGSFTLMIFPITIAIALLRYRLWDVDVVVRRTVGYAVLTGLLALIYFGSIVVLQGLFAPLTGDSTLATILSTLLIAALFLPLRRRIQDLIDRRFYRRKYDAAKVMESFAATARDETDLEQLTTELLRVIQETMEPEFTSIWLKPTTAPRLSVKNEED